jgi:hypothetical protein
MLARELGPELSAMVVVVFGQNATGREQHWTGDNGLGDMTQVPIMFHAGTDRDRLTDAVLMAQQKLA